MSLLLVVTHAAAFVAGAFTLMVFVECDERRHP